VRARATVEVCSVRTRMSSECWIGLYRGGRPVTAIRTAGRPASCQRGAGGTLDLRYCRIDDNLDAVGEFHFWNRFRRFQVKTQRFCRGG
jgi:hypothetical protein